MKRLTPRQKRHHKRRQQRVQRPVRRSHTQRVSQGGDAWESPLNGFVFQQNSPEPDDFHTWTTAAQERWGWENVDYKVLPKGWQILRKEFGLEESTEPLSGAEVARLWHERLAARSPGFELDDRQQELQFLLDVAYFLTCGTPPPPLQETEG